MKKIVGLTLLFTLQFTVSYTCDCIWGGNFFELTAESSAIVKVQILGHEKLQDDIDEILICKVLKIYKGNTKSDTVRLRGDNGILCAPYVSHFKIGQKYVIQYVKEVNSMPWLSNCGEFFLQIKGDVVYSEDGVRQNLPQIGTLPFDTFEQKLSVHLNRSLTDLTGEHSRQESTNKDNKTSIGNSNDVAQNWTSLFLIGIVLISILWFMIFLKKMHSKN